MSAIAEYAVHELLSGLAGGRVYAMMAPQNVTAPFIVFQRVSGDRWRSINTPLGIAQVEIQVDCYADEYYAMKSLADSVENILDGYRNTVYYGLGSPQDSVRIAGITLQNESEIFDQSDEPFLFRHTARYLVTYEQ